MGEQFYPGSLTRMEFKVEAPPLYNKEIVFSEETKEEVLSILNKFFEDYVQITHDWFIYDERPYVEFKDLMFVKYPNFYINAGAVWVEKDGITFLDLKEEKYSNVFYDLPKGTIVRVSERDEVIYLVDTPESSPHYEFRAKVLKFRKP